MTTRPQVESALSHELLSSPKTLNQEYYILLAKLHMAKGELTEAEGYVKQATVLNHTNPAGWALLGHILYLGLTFESIFWLHSKIVGVSRFLQFQEFKFQIRDLGRSLGSILYLVQSVNIDVTIF